MFQTLRARLIGICVFITVAALSFLAVATFLVVRNDTLESIDARIGQLTDIYSNELAGWAKDKQRATSSIKFAVGQDAPVPFLQAAKQSAGFDDAYFVYADKRSVFIQPKDSSYDGTARPWYKQAAQARGPALTPAYVDMTTGKLTISFVEPVISAGEVVAVVGSDMLLESVTSMVTGIRPSNKSFAFLLDGEGKILAHMQPDLALKPVSAISEVLDFPLIQRIAETNARADLSINGEPQMLYANKVEGTPWTLAIAIDRDEATAVVQTFLNVSITIAVLCVLVAVGLVTVVINFQLRRLSLVRDALQEIASGDGDLTRRMPAHGNDELTQICRAFNQFADKIAAVLSRIRDSSQSVRLATTEIASGNQDLSARTEQQASSLEETSAAMEQLTATVQQNAENAQQANQLANGASAIASHGGAVVSQVVETMSGIEGSSRKIADIIGVIDSIAFQTNILALNAAVEAARAGEQGRGFAVVASEVRTLAQRSATAAKEIKGLIDESVQQVTTGSRQVQDAGETMVKVVDSIRRVSAIVAEITNASQEQSTGIAEVGSAVSQMDQATQQNAALVEEATAAAQSLLQQAVQLADAVAGFKLPADGAEQRALGMH